MPCKNALLLCKHYVLKHVTQAEVFNKGPTQLEEGEVPVNIYGESIEVDYRGYEVKIGHTVFRFNVECLLTSSSFVPFCRLQLRTLCAS